MCTVFNDLPCFIHMAGHVVSRQIEIKLLIQSFILFFSLLTH